jgi:hypothetical protein
MGAPLGAELYCDVKECARYFGNGVGLNVKQSKPVSLFRKPIEVEFVATFRFMNKTDNGL